jgi:lipopolysaccharide/colanic/teichoic acid biosynthesis glycosyltransferase
MFAPRTGSKSLEDSLPLAVGPASQDTLSGHPYSLLQRVFDCLMALIAMIVFAPFMLLIAMLIRLDSPGPALFFQWRIGQDRRPFRFVKFRTLYADSRARFPELYAYEYSDEELANLQFKTPSDPRVTRIGRWLRDSTLDELPNFWNVLIGEMALVGPRPEIPDMLPYYRGKKIWKFSVLPGVTGLAQISGRGRLQFLESVDLDLQYVRLRTFFYDLKILVLTIRKVLQRDGAF